MYYTYDFLELTPEEQAEANKLYNETQFKVLKLTGDIMEAQKNGKDTSKLDAELSEITYNDPYRKYIEQAEKRHFLCFNGNLAAIYDDALERLPRLVERNYNGLISFINSDEHNQRAKITSEDKKKLLSPETMARRVQYSLTMHLEELRKDREKYDHIISAIMHQVKDYKYSYDVESAADPLQIPGDLISPTYGSILEYRAFPSFHGPRSDAFLKITPGIIKENVNVIASGKSKFEISGVQFEIENMTAGWTLKEYKMFLLLRGALTRINSLGSQDINTTVDIPLAAYGESIGWDIVPKLSEDAPESEKKKEKERIKNLKTKLRGKINESLSKMQILKFKGPQGMGGASSFITEYLVHRDSIKVTVSPHFVRMLIMDHNIEYIPVPLLKLGTTSKRSNQYSGLNSMLIGLKLLERYTNAENHNKQHVDPEIIGVKTLIGEMRTASFEDLKKINDTSHWKAAIKEKLEEALEELISVGFLSDYNYCKTHRAEVTPADWDIINTADAFTGYTAYEKLNIYFIIKEKVYDDNKMKTRKKEKNSAPGRSKPQSPKKQ